MKKRLDYIDMVKGIGIFLVVLGHMEDISGATRIWISSFHMPLFFICSGLLMAVKHEDEKDIKEVIKKKFRGIIIPYLWFSLSYFVIDILNVTVIGNIDLRTFIVDTVSSLTFYGMSVLWFLPALFIAECGFLFLKKKLPQKLTPISLIVISVAAYIIKLRVAQVYDLNADSLFITSVINIVYIFLRAAVALSFVGYAFYIRKIFDDSLTRNDKFSIFSKKPFCFAAGVVMLAVNIWLSQINQCVDLRNILLNNVPIYFIAAFLGSYSLILILKSLPSVKPITYFGKNSIIVMAAHVNYYFLYAGIKLAWVIVPHISHAKHYVFVMIVTATVFALCVPVIEAVNRWFPFITGKGSVKDCINKFTGNKGKQEII